jgi:serine protease Do
MPFRDTMIRSDSAVWLLWLGLFLASHATITMGQERTSGTLEELESQIRGLVERVQPTVVKVGGGTGVIIRDDGLVLTCYHVIDHLPDEVIPLTVAGGRTVQARKLGFDSGNDLALLLILDPQQKWPHASLGYSSLAQGGQWCLSLGYPAHAVADKPPILRLGRVLAVSPWWLAADSLAEGGDCGGPLFNLQGEVIAINTGGNTSLRGTTHIAIDVYRKAAARLQRGDRYRDTWRDEFDLASLYGILPAAGGDRAEIAAILPGSAAQKAGLRPGDIVSHRGDSAVERLGDLLPDLASPEPSRGGDISLTVLRGGRQIDCTLSRGQARRLPAFELMYQLVYGNAWLDEHADVERHQRNSPGVRRQFAQVTADARHAVVVVYVDGKRSRLGAVVGENGTIVTTAGDFSADIECRLVDGRRLPAQLVGQDARFNVALLQVDADGLSQLTWCRAPLPVGSLVIATQQHEEPLAYGVISSEPRAMRERLRDYFDWQDRRVTRVDPLRGAGVQLGDVIDQVNDVVVDSDQDLIEQLRQHQPGEPLLLDVSRSDPNATRRVLRITLPAFGYPEVQLHDAAIGSNHLGGPTIGLDGRAVGINVGRCHDISSCLLPSQHVQRIVEQISSAANRD